MEEKNMLTGAFMKTNFYMRTKPLKRRVATWCFVFLIVLSVSCASTGGGKPDAPVTLNEAIRQAAYNITKKLPEGSSIAVLQFTSESDALSDYIINELTYALVGGGLKVADRTNLEAARKELNFQASAEVDEKTAQKIGHFLGVEYKVVGEFVPAGDYYRFRVSTSFVETGLIADATICDVRNDNELRRMIAALDSNWMRTTSVKY